MPVWFLWHDGRVLEISDAYTAKYAEAMVAYGMELVAIAEKFHVVIELEPTDLQAW